MEHWKIKSLKSQRKEREKDKDIAVQRFKAGSNDEKNTFLMREV